MVQTIPWADQQDHGTWPRCEALFRKLLRCLWCRYGSVPGQRRPTPRARHAVLSSAARSALLVSTPAQPSTVRELLDRGARGRSVFATDVEPGPVDHIERRLHPFRAVGVEARRKRIAYLIRHDL